MIPVLYKSITEGTVPGHFGVGPLTDCLSAEVEESRNGEYELVLEYAAGGIHAEDIEPLMIIKAKPNYTDNPQLFEVYKVGKVMNGRFTVNAHHITYRLSYRTIATGTAGSCAAACALLSAAAVDYTINTDKTTAAAFKITEPSSIRSWFGGKSGSLLDKFGGEWKYDNFTASLLNARGMDRGTTITYGKNLTELSQEISVDNLATAILPYYKDSDGNVTTGAKVSTGLILTPAREIAVDFSSNVDPESATPIATQLATLAASYISKNNLTVAINSIKLDFEQLGELTERVDLCDTVHIYFDALGVTASAKCIETVWDVLQERYKSCTFGNPRTNIADTIITQEKEIEEKPSRSIMMQSIDKATALISGNLGGYVVLHDSNGDGTPDEILIMDSPDISTSLKIWRWNKNGLGYSNNGYAGPYGLAMTANGEIVADYITTGTLTANLIKAGVLEDVNHNSTIDMTSGAATLRDFYAKHWFRFKSDADVVLASIEAQAEGGMVAVGKLDTTQVGTLQATANGGLLSIGNGAGLSVASVYNVTGGGAVAVRSDSGDWRGLLYIDDVNLAAHLELYNHNSDLNVELNGYDGEITCVHVTQTSSRKEKENIKPMDDARRILELNAVSFDFKDKARGIDRRGFIAEDVAEILPNLVKPETDKTPAALDYVGMIPYLQQIIKEHETRIKELEAKTNGTD